MILVTDNKGISMECMVDLIPGKQGYPIDW